MRALMVATRRFAAFSERTSSTSAGPRVDAAQRNATVPLRFCEAATSIALVRRAYLEGVEMNRFKSAGLAAISAIPLLCIVSAPASAAGPLLLAPWVVGHLLHAALPYLAGTVAASASYGGNAVNYPPERNYYQPGYGYQPPAYYAPGAYHPTPTQYGPPMSSYAVVPRYYAAVPSYYGASAAYGRPYVHFMSHGYDAAPGMRYSAVHGAQVRYRGTGYYRRR